jgi:GINS complex subunit 1
MFTESVGTELIDEMRQSDLKQYNSKGILQLKNELKMVDLRMEELKKIAETSEITEEISVNFALLKAYKDRLTRISKGYHYSRFVRIQNSYFLKDNIKNKISLDEVEMLNDFSKISNEYLRAYTHLNLNDRQPPLNHYVTIITLADCGIVLIGDHFVTLKKDTIYFLKKTDIAHLLSARMVEVI